MTELRSQDRPAGERAARFRTLALAVVLAGMLMDLLDSGIVIVALAPIQAELNAGSGIVQWLVAGYSLPFALGLITGGRLGDIFGRKRVFMGGTLLFVLASVLCSAAQTGEQLVAGRVVQGLAAALMVPQVMATIQVMYAPHERGGAITAAGAMYAVSSVAGPIVGGVLTESDLAGLGWRAIFLVNLPFGLLVLLAAWFVLPESRSGTALRPDLIGMLLAGIGLLLLLLPLTGEQQHGPQAWRAVCLAASVPALALFVVHQRRKRDSPLVQLSLFGRRSFTGGMLVMLLGFGAIFGFSVMFTLYLQIGLGYSVLHSGVTGIWWGISSAVFAALAINVLARRFGRLIVHVGLAITVVGLLGLMAVALVAGPDADAVMFAIPLVVGGAGMGFALAVVIDFALADVSVDEAGSASGVLNAFQQVGAAIGASLIGASFFALLPPGPIGSEWPAAASDAFAYALLLPIGMVLLALAASFLLPARARHHGIP